MAKAKKGGKSHRKLLMVGPDAPFQFVEAYKSLRTNLEFLSASSGCKVILITSSVPEEGKSNVAINLATTMAAGGKTCRVHIHAGDTDVKLRSISLSVTGTRPVSAAYAYTKALAQKWNARIRQKIRKIKNK